MASFTINLEIRSRVGGQHNETFRARQERQRRDTTPVKTKGFKRISLFEKIYKLPSL